MNSPIETLHKLITKFGLEQRRSNILSVCRESFIYSPAIAEKGISKFGGVPLLAGKYGPLLELTEKMHFIGQFEVPGLLGDQSGLLTLFFEKRTQVLNGDIKIYLSHLDYPDVNREKISDVIPEQFLSLGTSVVLPRRVDWTCSGPDFRPNGD